MNHTKAKTKTEAVALAVAEFNLRHRLASLTQADLKCIRDDGKALDETEYLTRSPKNTRRLLASMRSLEAGIDGMEKLRVRSSRIG